MIIFANLYVSAALNYPDQVVWPVSHATTIQVSFILSYLQIGLFVWFFVWFFGGWVKRYWFLAAGGLAVMMLALIGKNWPYLTGQPISLTKIRPVHEAQEYLPPQLNKTVESYRGVFQWNRLSDNYYFYQRGIGGHADSEIVYSVGGRFSYFQTDYGVDTEGAAEAKVVFIIEGDGRQLFRSKVIGRFDNPQTVTVPINGVDKLKLRIVKGGENNYGAHADWLEPKLFR